MNHTLASAFVLALLAPPAIAQFTLAEKFGKSDGDNFGGATAFLGDLDGDGINDWASSAQAATVGGHAHAGRVRIYSGSTGVQIRTHVGTQATMGLGGAIADHGDINGDGVSDYAISAPGYDGPDVNNGRVMVYSGVDGSVLRVYTGPEMNSYLVKSSTGAATSMETGYGTCSSPSQA